MPWHPTEATSITDQHHQAAATIPQQLTLLHPTSYQWRELTRRFQAYTEDPKAPSRQRTGTCRTCFYLDARLAGQAFTDYRCEACGRQASWHTTAIPRLCSACARYHVVCQHCGGSMD